MTGFSHLRFHDSHELYWSCAISLFSSYWFEPKLGSAIRVLKRTHTCCRNSTLHEFLLNALTCTHVNWHGNRILTWMCWAQEPSRADMFSVSLCRAWIAYLYGKSPRMKENCSRVWNFLFLLGALFSICEFHVVSLTLYQYCMSMSVIY